MQDGTGPDSKPLNTSYCTTYEMTDGTLTKYLFSVPKPLYNQMPNALFSNLNSVTVVHR